MKTKDEIMKIVEEREKHEFFKNRCVAVGICHRCGEELRNTHLNGWTDPLCFNKECQDGRVNYQSNLNRREILTF